MPYVERTIRSGRLLEIDRYFAATNGNRAPRGRKEQLTSEEQQEINDRQAQRRLLRLINANFDGRRGDLFVTLTHAERVDEAEARRQMGRMIKRMRAARQKAGLEDLRYILITEQQSGRWHHHLICNGGLTLEQLLELWERRGRVQASILDEHYSYADLARYLTQQHKPRRGETGGGNAKQPRERYKRRWSSSHNLRQPEVKKREIKPSMLRRDPKPPKGWRLLPEWQRGADRWGNLYLHYECVLEETQTTDKKRKERKRE